MSLRGVVFVFPKFLRALSVVCLGIAVALSARVATAAIGTPGTEHGPSDSFWLDGPDLKHFQTDWGNPPEFPSGNTDPVKVIGSHNVFVPPPAHVFMTGHRGGYYGTLLQTLRFGIMPFRGYSIGMFSTPILYTPDGEPILPSSQANWVISGVGQIHLLDWVFQNGAVGIVPPPQSGAGPHVSSLGGPTGPGGIGGGGGGAQRTASTTTDDPGSNLDPDPNPNQNQNPGSNPGTTPVLDGSAGPSLVETPSSVPVPGALWLFGSGLAALVVAGRRKRA